MDHLGLTEPALAEGAPPLYAVACRWARNDDSWMLETWSHPLALGHSLPTLPVWLTDNPAVPLDLDESYEETCRTLRIPSP